MRPKLDVDMALAVLHALGCDSDPAQVGHAPRGQVMLHDSVRGVCEDLEGNRPASRVLLSYYDTTRARVTRGTLFGMVLERLKGFR